MRQITRFRLSFLATLVGLMSTQASAETLVEAMQLAVSRSPSVQYAKSEISASDSSVKQARSGWLPNISVSAGQQAVGKTSDNGDNQYSVMVQQNLFDFGRTGDRVDNAKFNKGAQIWQARDDAETVAAKVAEAYFNILKGQKLLENNKNEMIEHRRILTLATARADGGMDNQGDVRQVQVRIKGLEANAENIRAQLEATINEYQILVGKTPGTLEDTSLLFLHSAVSSGLKEKLSQSPQIRVLQMEQAAATSEYQYARKSWMPQLSVSLSQGKTSIYADNDTQIMLNVTSEVFNGGASYFQAQGAAQKIESARWKLQKALEDNATNISQLYQQALGYQQESVIYKSRVNQSLQVMDLYNDQYRVNRRSVLDLLNAAQEYYDTISNQFTADNNYSVTMVRAVSKLGKINELFKVNMGIAGDSDIDSKLENQNVINNSEGTTVPDAIKQTVRSPVNVTEIVSSAPQFAAENNIVVNEDVTILQARVSEQKTAPDNEAPVADIPDPLDLLK